MSSEAYDNKLSREHILLRAARYILRKCDNASYTLDPMFTTAVWDGVDCDGMCLLEEIKTYRGFGRI